MSMGATAPDQPEIDPPLGYFEDEPVWGAKLRVKGLGDGLSKLAEVEPVALGRRSSVVLVVQCVVDQVAFPAGEGPTGEPGVDRLHVLRAGLVTIVDRQVVATALDAQQRRNDELAGRKALFDADGNPTEPVGQDDEGEDDDLTEAERKAVVAFGDGAKRGRRRA